MSNALLGITREDLRREVADYLGLGRDYNSLAGGAQSQDVVDSAIRRGLRQFYYPPPIDENRRMHQWSFLRPVATLTTVIDQDTYSLPEDFAAMDGSLTYLSGTQHLHMTEVRFTSEYEIRVQQAKTKSVTFDRPVLAAVQPVGVAPSAASGQRWELLLWPTPKAVYQLQYRYMVQPQDISVGGDPFDANDRFLLGGAAHAETILQSCIAAAESMRSDRTDEYQRFIQRLAQSIAFDSAATTPERLGYVGDPSEYQPVSRRDRPISDVTYNGTLYGPS